MKKIIALIVLLAGATAYADVDVPSAPDLGTATSSDSIVTIDQSQAAGSKMRNTDFSGVATEYLDGVGGFTDPLDGVNSIQMTPITAPSHSEGLYFYDSANKTLSLFNEEADVTHQLGQEMLVRVYNDSGGDITNGQICYLSGVNSGFPTIALARADSASTSLATLGFATHTIENATFGYITTSGMVRSLSTTGYTTGDRLYLSATTSGGFTSTPPDSPNYLIGLGEVVVVDGAVGTIHAGVTIGTNTGGVIKIFNGSVLEDTATSVTSNGTVVTLSYEQNGGGDLSLFFDGGFDVFDGTPAATVALTAGSDTAPTLNYVYIPATTMVLTNSTVGFPSAQHVPVATVLVQSAASAQTDGVYKMHAWTDHLSGGDSQGHLAHVNNWIRNQPATWVSGVAPTTSITTNGGAIDNVYFSNSAGVVLQLHNHSFPAIDMSDPTPIFAVNDDTTTFRRVTDLSTLDEDSTGATLRSNNTYYSIVVFGVVSEDDADSKIYCNLPSGFYSNADDAQDDINKYSNYSIPTEFKGTGFLIARVTLRYQTVGSGTITEIQTEDLRGLVPSTAAGGGGLSSGAEFSDNLFRVQSVADSTKQIALDASAITTGNTRTLSMPDSDVDLADVVALGTASTRNAEDTLTNGSNLPDGAAIITYGNANWSSGSGDVVGPASSTDDCLAVYDGTTGKLLQDGDVCKDGSGNYTFPASVTTTQSDGNRKLTVLNNTTASPTASTNEIYPEANVWKMNSNGTEAAMVGDTTTQTLTNKTLTVANNTISDFPFEMCVAASDESTDLTTGTSKITFRMPYAITLTNVRSSAGTAPTGATLTVDINEAGTTVLSTKLTIDASEKTSVTAATPPVISDSSIADDAEMTIDIDQVGSTVAGTGLKVCLYGTRSI